MFNGTMVRLICGILLAISCGLAPNAVRADDEPALPIGLGETDAADDEPELPTGLNATDDDEPALPAGLNATDDDEPALPTGLGTQATAEPTQPAESQQQSGSLLERPGLRELDLTGFWEMRGGVRTPDDPHERDASIGESRLQLQLEKTWRQLTFRLTTDVYYDAVLDRHSVHLERGRGFLDLREASVAFSPLEFMDVKVGRQILTWGTGDLLFLNDMFPKDWQAFFIGRDVEYLKAPSDALKLSLFSDVVNWDIVYTPRFDPDRFITGERISYYDPMHFGRVGRSAVVDADIPNEWFRDHEWATRVSKNVAGWELAGYGYWGYWKSPGGYDFLAQKATFPRLAVYGGSMRGQLLGGIANVEAAYYDSREDRPGNNRFTNNSQFRFLVGYERQLPEIANDLTVGAQYYLEWMADYDDYRRTHIPLMPLADERRHVVTLRVEKLLLEQNLRLALFTYYSPSDQDAYVRPSANYKIDDHWSAEVGGNVFFGNDQHTFFNQFARNSNVYVALRYSF